LKFNHKNREERKVPGKLFFVIFGDVVPVQDYEFLYEQGAFAIFGPGTKIPGTAVKIMEEVNKRF
jgi:methylmalonyl-CoA mutase